VQVAAGMKVEQYLALGKGETVIGLVPLTDGPTIALGTEQGVVKRVAASELGTKDEIEIIALREGDRVVGAAPAGDNAELVFVADDAQLLRFDASSVRPQGRSAGGMAGIRLSDGARAIAFAVVGASAFDAVVVTVAGSSAALAGADAGSAKVSAFTEFPAKGRATGGVRAQRLLRGEDALVLAWVGVEPRAVGADGSVRTLPETGAKRDASGQPLDAAVGVIGTVVR
jgi:DNA gyrase subunit A